MSVIASFAGFQPELGPGVFVAPNATVIGRVTLGELTSLWYGVVARGDVGNIRIGARTNIQDLSVLHITGGKADTVVGDEVTVGHRAILHGCRVHDRVLVGIGAIILDGAEIGPYALVGAGSLVTGGTKIPEGSLVLGSPARVVRRLSAEERREIERSATRYVELAHKHARALAPRPSEHE